MAKLDDLIQQKQQRDEDWKAKKTAEREELGQLSDDAVMRVTSEPGAYLHYLDTQAINPRYSASNVMLAMAQNPEITYINSLEVWNRLGRSVNRDENGMKIRVSDTYVKDGREYHGYKIGRVFDVTQTHGKAGVPALSLKDNTPEMDAALRRLLDSSPVPVVTSSTMYQDAVYDPKTQSITVSSRLIDSKIFAALSREIVHAGIHDHGRYPYYTREDCAMDAESVSYMLCRNFGVETPQPDVSRVGQVFDGMEVQDRRRWTVCKSISVSCKMIFCVRSLRRIASSRSRTGPFAEEGGRSVKKKVAFALCTALMLCSMSVAALAAEPMTEADTVSTMISAADTLPGISAYPAEVRASEENGVYRLEKVYYLTAKDDPAAIPTADFEREGRTYTLLDLLKNDQTETDTREHIEVVTLESKTKDMAEILKMLEPKLEVETEDGYEGVLSLDHTTIQVEAAGYGTSSRTVTAERTYPNLSDADVSLVPKSVNENGRTLTLADVSWQEAAVDPTDGYDIPIRYTAVASYTGTATSKYATGYTVTADYKGDVTRTSCDTVIYTAVFSSVGAAASSKSGVDFNWLWLLLPVGAAALGGCGYAGYKGYRHYINKKRGYAA